MNLDPDNFLKLSRHNREAISNSEICSCYFCIGSFSARDVLDWTDSGDTAICPHCNVDAILPGLISKDSLTAAKSRFFAPSTR